MGYIAHRRDDGTEQELVTHLKNTAKLASKFSDGQRQKIAFARALVHARPILILDEATSNSDIYSEAKINRLFKRK